MGGVERDRGGTSKEWEEDMEGRSWWWEEIDE